MEHSLMSGPEINGDFFPFDSARIAVMTRNKSGRDEFSGSPEAAFGLNY